MVRFVMNTANKIPLLTILFFILLFTNSFAATLTGKVVRVLDGDTIEVLVDKEPIRIRLADIDCPEKNQPFGQAAKKYVLDVAAHKIEILPIHSKPIPTATAPVMPAIPVLTLTMMVSPMHKNM